LFRRMHPVLTRALSLSPVLVVALLGMATAPTLGAQEYAACPGSTFTSIPGAKEFLVDERGHILIAPTTAIKETDRIVVRMRTTPDVAKYLRVVRTSSLRGVGLGSIVGAAETTAAVDMLAKDAPSYCTMQVVFQDFAPGVGSVSLRLVATSSGTSTEVPVGVLDFRVEPDPIGAFSIGPARLELQSPTFSLLKTSEDTVITA